MMLHWCLYIYKTKPTCLDFHTSRTGMPAIIELGSSCAAELTVSLAPMTSVKSVSVGSTHSHETHEYKKSAVVLTNVIGFSSTTFIFPCHKQNQSLRVHAWLLRKQACYPDNMACLIRQHEACGWKGGGVSLLHIIDLVILSNTFLPKWPYNIKYCKC